MPYKTLHIVMTGNSAFKIANFRSRLIREFIKDGHHVTVVAPGDEYVDDLRKLGCAFVPLSLSRTGLLPHRELASLLSLFAIFWNISPDIVLSYTIKNNIYSGLVCRALRIPTVPNITGLGQAFKSRYLIRHIVLALYRLSLSNSLAVFFQNPEDLSLFVRNRLTTHTKAQLLPGSGVDLNRFHFMAMPPDTDQTTFLLVGRMIWDKGIQYFVEAAKHLKKTHPRIKFQLLGPLDEESPLGIPSEQINRWIRTGSVEYLGPVRDVLPYLHSADCIVLPSFYPEGTPKSLLEACAAGRPVITTDTPGCRNTVRDRVNGFLIRPKDTKSLITSIEYFLALSHEARADMGAASRILAESEFDEMIVVNKYFEIIKNSQRA